MSSVPAAESLVPGVGLSATVRQRNIALLLFPNLFMLFFMYCFPVLSQPFSLMLSSLIHLVSGLGVSFTVGSTE